MSLPIGQRHGQHKLEDEDVHSILNLHEWTRDLPKGHPEKWTYRRLAQEYGISVQSIAKCINGETYPWVHEARRKERDGNVAD